MQILDWHLANTSGSDRYRSHFKDNGMLITGDPADVAELFASAPRTLMTHKHWLNRPFPPSLPR